MTSSRSAIRGRRSLAFRRRAGVFAIGIWLSTSSLGFPDDLPLNRATQILPPTDDEYSAAMAELSEISALTARHAANFGALPDPGEQGLAAAHHELERLKTELDTLKSAAGKPALPAAPSDADLAALAQKLQDSLDRITLLKSQIEQRRNMKPPEAPPPKAGVSSQEVITGKKPIIVKLIGGRVVPLAEPYFSITKHFVATNCADAIEVTRQRNGEPLEAATDDSGILTALTRQGDPQTHFFAFLVAPDAIDVFRAARRFVTGKGFAFFWRPDRDQTMNLCNAPTSSQGGDRDVWVQRGGQ